MPSRSAAVPGGAPAAAPIRRTGAREPGGELLLFGRGILTARPTTHHPRAQGNEAFKKGDYVYAIDRYDEARNRRVTAL